MKEDPARERTQKLLDDAKRLVGEIDAALERGRRVFASKGLSVEQMRERVSRMDPQARQQVQHRVDQSMRELAERSRTAAAHATFDVPTSSRPPRRVRNLI